MELRHLRYFVTIAEERSFTRAAERLWVAQPGLSTQIRRLEAELGIQLFERHTRGVDLTQAGEVFLERSRAALVAAENAAATGRDLEAGMVGSVRLGLATDARWQRTSNVLSRFAGERDGVELTVLEGHGGTLWRDLRGGRLDAVLGPADLGSPDLLALDLGPEPWLVLVGRDHRLAGSGTVDARELQGETIMVTGHRDGAAFDRAIAHLLEELDVAARLEAGGPGPALLARVAAGDALVLTTGADPVLSAVTSRPLHPARTLAFQLLWRDEAASPALNALIALAAQEAQQRSAARTPLAAVA
jgi:DNA-binding transcriptional LysR family regulator